MPEALPADAAAEWATLADHGFGWILVHPRLASSPDRCIGALTEALGPPVVETESTVGWRVPGAQ